MSKTAKYSAWDSKILKIASGCLNGNLLNKVALPMESISHDTFQH